MMAEPSASNSPFGSSPRKLTSLHYTGSRASSRVPARIRIKVLHTVIWLFFVVCVLGIPIAAARGQFPLAAVLSALVLGACVILALNHGTCP